MYVFHKHQAETSRARSSRRRRRTNCALRGVTAAGRQGRLQQRIWHDYHEYCYPRSWCPSGGYWLRRRAIRRPTEGYGERGALVLRQRRVRSARLPSASPCGSARPWLRYERGCDVPEGRERQRGRVLFPSRKPDVPVGGRRHRVSRVGGPFRVSASIGPASQRGCGSRKSPGQSGLEKGRQGTVR